MSTSTPTQGEFRLVGIAHAPFAHLFERTDEQLRAKHAVRRVATASTGYPCRVSLEDARQGDEIAARFVDPEVAYVHLHNAKQGCFSCLAVRS